MFDRLLYSDRLSMASLGKQVMKKETCVHRWHLHSIFEEHIDFHRVETRFEADDFVLYVKCAFCQVERVQMYKKSRLLTIEEFHDRIEDGSLVVDE